MSWQTGGGGQGEKDEERDLGQGGRQAGDSSSERSVGAPHGRLCVRVFVCWRTGV